jgi:hypothetical protein
MGPGGTMNFQVNKLSRQKMVMLAGLSIVAAAVAIRLLSSGPESAPAATVTSSSATNLDPTPSQPVKGAMAVVWPTDIARDPFHSDRVFPPAAPPEPKQQEVPTVVAPSGLSVDYAAIVREKMNLKGTILGERPIAMMNGRVYRIGEVLEGFTIVEIEKNQITVEREGTRFVVTVN